MIRISHETHGRLRLRLPAIAVDANGSGIVARLEAVDGVRDVRLNAACASIVVAYDGAAATRQAVLAAVRHPVAADAAIRPTDSGPDFGQVLLSGAALLALPLLPPPLKALVTVVNVAGVVGRGARMLFAEGLKVEVLDAVAITLPTLRREWFTANFARFLLDLGSYIEASTARRSDKLLRDLLKARPDTVTVETPDGELRQLPWSEVKVGARVVVGTGDQIPVDGIVADGDAWVDQAAVTGESLPIPRGAGDEVLSGSVVNEGRLTVIAERVGDATTTARISRYILEALADPSQIQCMSQKMADRRILITLLSGLGVFAITRDWRRLESVFLVDYSCAVKFGTPMAIKAAMFRSAKEGCLIKSGHSLETFAAVDTVVFDKTGTLTHNTLQVTDIHRPDSCRLSEEELLATVASVAEHTSHPVAGAIVNLAKARHLAHIGHEEVNFLVGHGIASTVHGMSVRIGSRHYLEEHEGVSFASSERLIQQLAEAGKSMLFVAADGQPIGIVGLRDRLRDEAQSVLNRLRTLGVKSCVMITGDHAAKARIIGDTLGLDRVFCDQKPEDKAALVESLKAEGRTVAFVGDGVNDGPALMAADVGIAMPRATDIARATADIILLEDRLDGLASLRGIAQDTLALIQSNFTASVAINSAIMAGAVLGRLSPVATATLHNGTTIAILLRALASSGRSGSRT
ncbi:heavy metal translocating P-type ATPase [Rhodopseudomonas palustris]|uniref:P-type Zn(2+) transporter n=1 Tax=Rhodopseudomonas palustris TaxID=1076 RepID=A0A323UGF3_RHOPL|nr:heavy metal translocating P-type ATPase [Rhodopseudomonas palustris]